MLDYPIDLSTSNGKITVSKGVEVSVPGVGILRCIKVPKSPFLVSVGRLVEEESYIFNWSPGRCCLTAPDGREVKLTIENFVPMFAGTAGATTVPAAPILRSAIELAVREVLSECVDGCSHVATVGKHHLTHLPADPECQVCTQGKLKRFQARRKPNSANVAKAPLERVYADCIGPNSEPSSHGNKYALVFRDEYSGRTYCHALRNIDSATILRCFQMSFPESQGLPKTVRADSGPEFSGDFQEYCITKGIARERGLPNVPQTRGRGEAFHGVLNAGIRSMLAQSGLSVRYWDLAMLHWVHNYNHSVVQPLTGKVPAIVMKMPVCAILVPFGCYAISMREKVHHTRMSKWDPSSGPGIIVGYAENRGYLVYEINDKGTITSQLRSTRNCRVYADKYPIARQSNDLLFNHFDIESYLDEDRVEGVIDDPVDELPREPIPNQEDHAEDRVHVPDIEISDIEEIDPFEEERTGSPRSPSVLEVSPTIDAPSDRLEQVDADQLRDVSEVEEYCNLPDGVADCPEVRKCLKRLEMNPDYWSIYNLPESSDRIDRAAKRNRIRDAGASSAPSRSVVQAEQPPSELVQENADVEMTSSVKSSARLANKRARDQVSNLPPSDGFESASVAIGIIDRRHEDQTQSEVSHDRIREFLNRDDPLQHSFVTKVVTSKDPEWNSDAARNAFLKERLNLEEKQVVNWSSVREWKDAKREFPNACVVRLHTILGIKNWERPTSEHIYKGRIVGGGHNVRTAEGKKAEKDQLFGTPVPLPIMRAVITHGMVHDYPIEVADVDGAYLTATLRGPPMFGRIPPELRPSEWANRFYDPVVRIEKALYGLPRAGFDWYHYFEQILLSFSWTPVEGFDSVYTFGNCVLAAYVDDIIITGPKAELRQRWSEIKSILKLKSNPEKLREFLGIKFIQNAISKYGRELITDQSDYCKMVVSKYLKETGKSQLRSANTPTLNRSQQKFSTIDEALDYADTEDLTPGRFANTCRQYIGALLWLMRASRSDLAWAVHRLAKQAHCWSKDSDNDLSRIIQYLQETSSMVLKEFIDVRDRNELVVTGYTDSDWAGDLSTRKSTPGMVLFATGPNGTKSIIEYGAKLQTFVARSSGEAEVVALSRCLAQCGVSVQLLLGSFSKYKPRLEVFCDSEVAIRAVLAGSSAQMRYIQKTQAVHLAWLRQLLSLDDISLHKVDTEDNVADIMTKGLHITKFSKFRTMLGIMDE